MFCRRVHSSSCQNWEKNHKNIEIKRGRYEKKQGETGPPYISARTIVCEVGCLQKTTSGHVCTHPRSQSRPIDWLSAILKEEEAHLECVWVCGGLSQRCNAPAAPRRSSEGQDLWIHGLGFSPCQSFKGSSQLFQGCEVALQVSSHAPAAYFGAAIASDRGRARTVFCFGGGV